MLAVLAAGLQPGEVTMWSLLAQQLKLSVRAICGDLVLKLKEVFTWLLLPASLFLCVHVQVRKEHLIRTISVEIWRLQ